MSAPVSIYCRLTRAGPLDWRAEVVGGDEQAPAVVPQDWLPWMGLDEGVNAPDGRAEAWSCVGGEGYSLLTRSVPAPPSTLAHAVLSTSDEDGSAAEALLWRSPFLAAGSDGESEPALDTAAARALLGHLYGALVRGAPVAIAAPPEDFVAPGRVARAALFAHRALPPALGRRCRVRIFTHDPALYLETLGASLIAVPVQDAAKALMARRDATLLDSDGNLVEGPPLSESASRYAAEAIAAASGGAEARSDFLKRVAVLIPEAALPSEGQLAALPFVRALSTPDAPLPELREGAHAIDWGRVLVSDADWERLPIAMFDTVAAALPREAVDRLLASGEWREWRAKTQCEAGVRRTAAKAWCASAVHAVSSGPAWEDWMWIASDLGPALSAGDLEEMRSHSGFFPPICWFERDQQAFIESIASPDAQQALQGGRAATAAAPEGRVTLELKRMGTFRVTVDLRDQLAALPALEPRGPWRRFRDWLAGLLGGKGSP